MSDPTGVKEPQIRVRPVVYRTRSLRPSQRWAWRLVALNGRIVATSGEGYRDKSEARRMMRRLARGVVLVED